MTTILTATSIHSLSMQIQNFLLLMVPQKFRSRVLVLLIQDNVKLVMITEQALLPAMVILALKKPSLLIRTP